MIGASKILIVTGDDFGASPAINAAIIRAHSQGILTSASLLVNGDAFDEAVELARAHPTLGVGIHISLIRGKSILPSKDLPRVVDRSGSFSQNPIIAGLRYFFDSRTKVQLQKEVEAQIRKFLATGLTPSHIDGHLHLHVHPAVLKVLLPLVQKYAIPAFRLPKESLGVNLRLDRRNLFSKSVHALIYHLLSTHAEKKVRAAGLAFPDAFFGLLASGHMNESYFTGLIARMRPGVTEVGMHPALFPPPELSKWAPRYEYPEELKALLSPKVREGIQKKGIELASYKTWLARPSPS